MGGMSTIVKHQDIAKLQEQGGYCDSEACIVPIEGRMYLLESEDGQFMIDGEGYHCRSRKDARETLKEYGEPGFEWVKTHHFHTMDMPVKMSDEEGALCSLFGFDVFGSRRSEDGWLVLQIKNPPSRWRPYRGGRIIDGNLFVVGDDLGARVPEEAVGYCVCSRYWGDRPNSEYALLQAARMDRRD